MSHFSIRIKDDACTEIDNFDAVYLTVRIQKKILWLQISMTYFAVVAVDYCREELLHNDGRIRFWEGFDLADFIKELTTIDIFRDQIEV